MNLKMKHTVVVMLGLLAGALPAHAQWLTQTITLNAGWNAIYLHVDASHTTLQDLIGSARCRI